MEPKSEVRHPLNRHSPEDPVKKGAMCNPYIIYYVSSTSALFEKVTFSFHGAPQNKGKIGSATEVAKKHRKHQAKGAKGEPKGRPWGPEGSPGSPKWLSNPIEIPQKTGSLSRCPPKGCQGYPWTPQKYEKKNKGKLTRTRAQHSQKNRDGEEVFAETRGINRASPSPKIGDGDAPHAMSSEVLSITGTGYLKARWRAGALRPWIRRASPWLLA